MIWLISTMDSKVEGMGTVAEGLARVHERIAAAERAAGRPLGSVRLLAVSKRHRSAAIRNAYACGQREFGENYAQELAGKAAELADLTDLELLPASGAWIVVAPLRIRGGSGSPVRVLALAR